MQIGKFTYGFDQIKFWYFGEGKSITIGNFCSIAPNVNIFLGGNHRTDWITTYPFGHVYPDDLGGESIKGHPSSNGNVIIGNDVWVGFSATIMSGITVGDGAVISANSVVTRDVNPYEVVGGNPAKFIKKRFDKDIVDLLLKLRWWDLSLEVIKEIAPQLCTPPNKKFLLDLIQKYCD
jgi:acetyltransferase-like isoleucine patch superfamily enzyme